MEETPFGWAVWDTANADWAAIPDAEPWDYASAYAALGDCFGPMEEYGRYQVRPYTR